MPGVDVNTQMHVRGIMDFVGILYQLGARRFLTGTDCVAWVISGMFVVNDLGCTPGFSVLEEIVFLAGAGLSPLEALQASTLRPAQFLEATDSLGTVADGKLADLVLLDANPLANIQNIMQIRAVIANGRYFDRAALDVFDAKAGQRVEAFTKQLPALGIPAVRAP